MIKEKVIYIGGKKYVEEADPDAMLQKPEPEEVKWLTPPPRKLSPWVTLRLLAGAGLLLVFGWIFACFGMFAVCMTLGELRFADLGLLASWKDAGTGTVVSSEDIKFSVGEKPVHRHVFRRTAEDGGTAEGSCYSFEKLEENAETNLERYGNTGTYRLKGTTLGKMGVEAALTGGLFTLVFPMVGLGIVAGCLYFSLRNLRLLKTGEIAKGNVADIRINRGKKGATSQTVTYRFTAADGKTHTASYTLPLHLTFDRTAYQVLFYDSQKPRRILPHAALTESGIGPDPQMGEYRVTSVWTYIYTTIMTAVSVFFITVLIWELGVLFGLWTW